MIRVYLGGEGERVEKLRGIFEGELGGRLREEGKKEGMELGEWVGDIGVDGVVRSDLEGVVDRVEVGVGGGGGDGG